MKSSTPSEQFWLCYCINSFFFFLKVTSFTNSSKYFLSSHHLQTTLSNHSQIFISMHTQTIHGSCSAKKNLSRIALHIILTLMILVDFASVRFFYWACVPSLHTLTNLSSSENYLFIILLLELHNHLITLLSFFWAMALITLLLFIEKQLN